jgi:hypothetical protein
LRQKTPSSFVGVTLYLRVEHRPKYSHHLFSSERTCLAITIIAVSNDCTALTQTLTSFLQGSVYVFENDTKPVLTQIDGWHEATHFSRWTKDISLEAELHDDHAATNGAPHFRRVTERAAGSADSDYTSFVTFVELPLSQHEPATLRFSVQPRAGGDGAVEREYEVLVRYRVDNAATTTTRVHKAATDINNVTADVGDGEVRLSVATSSDQRTVALNTTDVSAWRWHTMPGRFRVRTDHAGGEFVDIVATGSSGSLHVDAIKLRDLTDETPV